MTVALPWMDMWPTNPKLSTALDKRGYADNIFLISPQKHMLWELIISEWSLSKYDYGNKVLNMHVSNSQGYECI